MTRQQERDVQEQDTLEALIAEIMGAVFSLEYGAVTVSVKGGHVTQVERHEKRRLPKAAVTPFERKAYAA
jgi:hypothetical protein